MSVVAVSAIRRGIERGQGIASATVRVGERRFDAYIRISEGGLSQTSDAWLAAAILPAMRMGLPVRVEGSVSPQILDNLSHFQSIIHTWFKQFSVVAVDAARAAVPVDPAPAWSACFFSGGVDSSYSVLKNLDQLTHLIFVHGFDIGLDETAKHKLVIGKLRQAAASLSRPLIEVETNVKSLLDPFGEWGMHMHGAAMTAVALAQANLRRAHIAGARAYDQLILDGSHPLSTPLWSSENMQIVFDGGEATRWQKLDYLAQHKAAHEWLRVCWVNKADEYNCNRCDKCLPTRAFAHMLGQPDLFKTFAPLRDLHELDADLHNVQHRSYWMRWLAFARERHPDAEATQYVGRALDAPATGEQQRSPEAEVWRLTVENERLFADVQAATELATQRAEQIERLHHSLSWRVTAPLRAVAQISRLLRR